MGPGIRIDGLCLVSALAGDIARTDKETRN